jgi:predicted nucleotidyltransferase
MDRDDILGLLPSKHHILLAVESGSRMWGFASPDSDWDVRFIYMQKDLRRYVNLFVPNGTIETTLGDVDMAGWEVTKALQLAAKSNPSLLEWLHSPIVYTEQDWFADELRSICTFYDARALGHHYASMLKHQKQSYWREGMPVPYKKYLYAIRPILCLEVMKYYDWTFPPVDFKTLYSMVIMRPEEENELDDLLARKAASSEAEVGRYPALDHLIDKWMLLGHQTADTFPAGRVDVDALNNLYRKALAHYG